MSAFWIAAIVTIAIPIALVIGALSFYAYAAFKKYRGVTSTVTITTGSWISRHPIWTTEIALLLLIPLIIFYAEIWGWIISTSSNVSIVNWVILVMLLTMATSILSNPWKRYARAIAIAALVIPPILWLSPFLNRAAETLDRGINHGDWSASADYIQTMGGGTLYLRSGESKTIILTGRIMVPNQEPYHCVDVRPAGATDITWTPDVTRVWVEPKTEQPVELVIRKLRQGQEQC